MAIALPPVTRSAVSAAASMASSASPTSANGPHANGLVAGAANEPSRASSPLSSPSSSDFSSSVSPVVRRRAPARATTTTSSSMTRNAAPDSSEATRRLRQLQSDEAYARQVAEDQQTETESGPLSASTIASPQLAKSYGLRKRSANQQAAAAAAAVRDASSDDEGEQVGHRASQRSKATPAKPKLAPLSMPSTSSLQRNGAGIGMARATRAQQSAVTDDTPTTAYDHDEEYTPTVSSAASPAKKKPRLTPGRFTRTQARNAPKQLGNDDGEQEHDAETRSPGKKSIPSNNNKRTSSRLYPPPATTRAVTRTSPRLQCTTANGAAASEWTDDDDDDGDGDPANGEKSEGDKEDKDSHRGNAVKARVNAVKEVQTPSSALPSSAHDYMSSLSDLTDQSDRELVDDGGADDEGSVYAMSTEGDEDEELDEEFSPVDLRSGQAVAKPRKLSQSQHPKSSPPRLLQVKVSSQPAHLPSGVQRAPPGQLMRTNRPLALTPQQYAEIKSSFTSARVKPRIKPPPTVAGPSRQAPVTALEATRPSYLPGVQFATPATYQAQFPQLSNQPWPPPHLYPPPQLPHPYMPGSSSSSNHATSNASSSATSKPKAKRPPAAQVEAEMPKKPVPPREHSRSPAAAAAAAAAAVRNADLPPPLYIPHVPTPALETLRENLQTVLQLMRVEATDDPAMQEASQQAVEHAMQSLPTKVHRSTLLLVMNRYSSFCATAQVDVPSFPLTADKIALMLARASHTPLGARLRALLPQPPSWPQPLACDRNPGLTPEEGPIVTRELVRSWIEALVYAQSATGHIWQHVQGVHDSRIAPLHGEASPAPSPVDHQASLTRPVVKELMDLFQLAADIAPPYELSYAASPLPPPSTKTTWTRGGRAVDAPSKPLDVPSATSVVSSLPAASELTSIAGPPVGSVTPSDIFKQPETSMPAVVGASKPSTRPSSAKPPSKPSDYFSVPRTASRPTSRSASRSTTHSASRSTALSTPRPLPSSSIAPGCQMATYPLATMYPPFYPQHLGAYYAIPQDAAFHHPALMGHHGGMVPAASPQAAHVPRYMPSSSSPDPGHYSSAQTQAANDLLALYGDNAAAARSMPTYGAPMYSNWGMPIMPGWPPTGYYGGAYSGPAPSVQPPPPSTPHDTTPSSTA